MTRFRMLKLLAVLAACALGPTVSAPAQTDASAASGTILGVAAPLSDSPAILGRQVVDGAWAAANPKVQIDTADTTCSAEGGRQAAQRFVDKHATVVVGFLCTDAIEAALPILTKAGIPTIDVGVRANRLTDRRSDTGYDVWRIAPRSDADAKAIADYLAKRWSDVPFGLVNDGAIAHRNLTEAIRRLLKDRGLEPQVVDNYRPAEEKQFGLVRRLQRSGVTRFFIAGDRPDVAIIARDAASSGLDLEIVGGEELFDETSQDTPLPDGIVAIGPQTRFPKLSGDTSANADNPDLLVPQGYFGPAYAAAQIAIAAAEASRATGRPIGEILASRRFDTALGPIGFDVKGDSDLDLFGARVWRGDRFVDAAGG